MKRPRGRRRLVPRRPPWIVLAGRDDVLRLGALLPLGGLELDLRALGERLEAVARDRAVVDEQVLATLIGGDEPIALRVVEPLDGSGCHIQNTSSSPSRTGREGASCAIRYSLVCRRTVARLPAP